MQHTATDDSSYDLVIVVVSYNSEMDVERCIDSINTHLSLPSPLRWSVVVADNASSDNSVSILNRLDEQYPWLHILPLNKNQGYAGAHNLVFSAFSAKHYFLLNVDAWLIHDIILPTLHAMQRMPRAAICGCPLVFPDGTPQTCAHAFSSGKKWLLHFLGLRQVASAMLESDLGTSIVRRFSFSREFVTSQLKRQIDPFGIGAHQHTYELRKVDWVCGAAMLIDGQLIETTGGFDPAIFLYGEDEDLCIQATRLGRKVVEVDSPPVVHAFGWGKNRFNRKVADMKYVSLKYFINKNIGSRLERFTMLSLLPFHVYGKRRFHLAWSNRFRHEAE